MDKSSKPVAVKSEAAAKADVTIKADKTAGKPAPAVKAEVKPAPAVRSPTRAAAANGKGEGVKMEAKRSGRPTKPAVVEKEIESEDDSDSDESSDDDVPLKERQASKPSPASKAMPSAPLVKKSRSSNASGSVNGGEDKWYEAPEDVDWKRGAIKWTTLEHGGVIFPPPYAPHGIKMLYDGKPVELNAEQEEVATMFAAMKDTDYGKNPIFQKNFMDSWRPLLKKTPEGKPIKDLSKCDFSRIADYLADAAARKKEMGKEEKAALKEAKEKAEAHCTYALVDGRKEKVGNFRVEPPGLFRGRGAHPKMGQLKARIVPEDITINVSKGAPVPKVPDLGDGKKHKWAEVVHLNTVTWLAKWKDTINGEEKYVMLAANSSWKGMSDMAKYNKARELKQHIDKVRTDYMKAINSSKSTVKEKQLAVAVYLIDRLALRVGNEKNTEEEADTVGCCSLRVEHVFLQENNQLHLKFLGKDSIEYNNTTEIIPGVYACLTDFLKRKKPEDEVFDQVTPTELNVYFKSVMEGLSAKVFRTYNASFTLDRELQKTETQVTKQQREKEGDINALFNYYNIANKNVAELCNHQRATPASHQAVIARFDEKIDKVKLEMKEAKKAGSQSKVDALKKRLIKLEADKQQKEEIKNVSLGTSKINYNDPRITVAWCKLHDVPIQKPFAKTLLAKFTWAMSTEPTYRF